MHRIDTKYSIDGKFIDRDTDNGSLGTYYNADYMNDLQEEFKNLVLSANMIPTKGNNRQLYDAINYKIDMKVLDVSSGVITLFGRDGDVVVTAKDFNLENVTNVSERELFTDTPFTGETNYKEDIPPDTNTHQLANVGYMIDQFEVRNSFTEIRNIKSDSVEIWGKVYNGQIEYSETVISYYPLAVIKVPKTSEKFINYGKTSSEFGIRIEGLLPNTTYIFQIVSIYMDGTKKYTSEQYVFNTLNDNPDIYGFVQFNGSKDGELSHGFNSDNFNLINSKFTVDGVCLEFDGKEPYTILSEVFDLPHDKVLTSVDLKWSVLPYQIEILKTEDTGTTKPIIYVPEVFDNEMTVKSSLECVLKDNTYSGFTILSKELVDVDNTGEVFSTEYNNYSFGSSCYLNGYIFSTVRNSNHVHLNFSKTDYVLMPTFFTELGLISRVPDTETLVVLPTNGNFFAVSDNSGVDWVEYPCSIHENGFSHVSTFGKRLVAFSRASQQYMFSDDGKLWNNRRIDILEEDSKFGCESSVEINGRFYICYSELKGQLVSTSDLEKWESTDMLQYISPNEYITSLTINPEDNATVIASISNTTDYLYSTDLMKTWKRGTLKSGSKVVNNKVVFTNGVFIMYSDSNCTNVQVSPDFSNWRNISLESAGKVNGFFSLNNIIYIVKDDLVHKSQIGQYKALKLALSTAIAPDWSKIKFFFNTKAIYPLVNDDKVSIYNYYYDGKYIQFEMKNIDMTQSSRTQSIQLKVFTNTSRQVLKYMYAQLYSNKKAVVISFNNDNPNWTSDNIIFNNSQINFYGNSMTVVKFDANDTIKTKDFTATSLGYTKFGDSISLDLSYDIPKVNLSIYHDENLIITEDTAIKFDKNDIGGQVYCSEVSENEHGHLVYQQGDHAKNNLIIREITDVKGCEEIKGLTPLTDIQSFIDVTSHKMTDGRTFYLGYIQFTGGVNDIVSSYDMKTWTIVTYPYSTTPHSTEGIDTFGNTSIVFIRLTDTKKLVKLVFTDGVFLGASELLVTNPGKVTHVGNNGSKFFVVTDKLETSGSNVHMVTVGPKETSFTAVAVTELATSLFGGSETNNKIFITSGSGNTLLYYLQPSDMTWVKTNIAVNGGKLLNVVYNTKINKYAALFDKVNTLYYSNDSKTWYNTGIGVDLIGLLNCKEDFVAYRRDTIVATPDGINWESTNWKPSLGVFTDIKSMTFLSGDNGTEMFIVSGSEIWYNVGNLFNDWKRSVESDTKNLENALLLKASNSGVIILNQNLNRSTYSTGLDIRYYYEISLKPSGSHGFYTWVAKKLYNPIGIVIDDKDASSGIKFDYKLDLFNEGSIRVHASLVKLSSFDSFNVVFNKSLDGTKYHDMDIVLVGLESIELKKNSKVSYVPRIHKRVWLNHQINGDVHNRVMTEIKKFNDEKAYLYHKLVQAVYQRNLLEIENPEKLEEFDAECRVMYKRWKELS